MAETDRHRSGLCWSIAGHKYQTRGAGRVGGLTDMQVSGPLMHMLHGFGLFWVEFSGSVWTAFGTRAITCDGKMRRQRIQYCTSAMCCVIALGGGI